MDEELRARIDVLVRAGYQSRDEIVEGMEELVEDDGGTEDADAMSLPIGDVVDRAIAAHRAEARSWTDETDNDRLDRAFAALEAAGLIARQDFACCTTCATSEIWDEVSEPSAWRGNVWFHQQDTERAVEGDGLYLGYGARDERSRWRRLRGAGASDASDDTAAIGREVAQALRDAGLAVTWDGHVDRRILVAPFVWRRRPRD